jgi:hypothetical protein
MATISSTKHETPLWNTSTILGACLVLAIAGFFLWQEHRAHVLGILPYVLLAACPIVHLLMHGGHRRHRGTHSGGDHDGRHAAGDRS